MASHCDEGGEKERGRERESYSIPLMFQSGGMSMKKEELVRLMLC